jgi:hypothetical protein
MRGPAALFAVAASLASCGRPDASGIYLVASDRQVTLVQLVETKEGNVTGRLEQMSIGADGNVIDQATALDGAASQHDLMLKPASAWFGGLSASGTFSGDHLTLAGNGFTIDAQRVPLAAYQKAVAGLQALAAADRKRIADAQAAQAAAAAQAQAARDAADKTARIQATTARLRNDTARMNAAIANCPDFGSRSAANTARIANMLRVAPTLSDFDRNRLVVAANQVEVGTNQIEVARSQYAIALNGIVQDAAPIAQQLTTFCASAEGAQFGQQCADAKTAASDFIASLARGRTAFNGYKQAVQTELDRQAAMIQRMGG